MAIFHSYVKLPEGTYLLGGVNHVLFSIIYGIIPTPLTNSYFSRWLKPPTRYVLFRFSFLFSLFFPFLFLCMSFSFPLPFLFLSSSFHVFFFPFLFLSSSVLFLSFSFCVLFLFRFSSFPVPFFIFLSPCLVFSFFVPLPFLYCHKTMESSRAPKRTSGSLEKTMGIDNGSYT